jgi:methionyl-tRNA formyltransferase
MYICIAGKNNCAIDAIKFLLKKKININRILTLPNYNDKGIDDWQPSFKKFALKNKIKIIKLKNLYVIKKLLFFSLEYEKIINIHKFQSKKLYNLHFSLLPKYRGCHTNFLQIYKGERFSGVTLHKIDNGIDTGEIIDQKRFKIKINDTAYQNYIKLMELSVKIFKRNLFKIINNNYKTKKQKLSNGSYFSRNSVNYNKISKFKVKNFNIKMHNKIRSLIFPAYQLPEVNGVKIVKSIYKNKKVNLIEYND